MFETSDFENSSIDSENNTVSIQINSEINSDLLRIPTPNPMVNLIEVLDNTFNSTNIMENDPYDLATDEFNSSSDNNTN